MNVWYKRNPEKRKEICKKYYLKHKDKIKAKRKINRLKQNENARRRTKEREIGDINFKLKRRLRHRLYLAIKKEFKKGSAIEYLGCSMKNFKEYIASKFQPNMSWENYGDWHIDHIKPCASFDLRDFEQQKVCFHYSNLQPLWAEDNLSKGAKYQTPLEPKPPTSLEVFPKLSTISNSI